MFWDEIQIIIISCLITLLIVFIYILFRLNEPLDLPKSKIYVNKTSNLRLESDFILDPIIKQFNTGDILMVSYNSFRGRLVRVFTGSMWTHVGMIYKKENGELFVIESSQYEDVSGVVKTPIHKWLDWNENRILAWLHHKGPKIKDKDIEDIFEKVRDAKVDLFVGSWLRAVIKQKYYPQPNKNKFFCSELVTHFLQELNIIQKIYLPSGYPPKEILFGKLPLINGHNFDEPKLLLMN